MSRLVVLHEEAEDGNAMPDLERPVQVVSKAVSNLVKVQKYYIYLKTYHYCHFSLHYLKLIYLLCKFSKVLRFLSYII